MEQRYSATLKCDKVVETPVQIVFVDNLRISSSLSILDKLGRPLWGLGALRDSGPSYDPFLDFPSKKTQKNIIGFRTPKGDFPSKAATKNQHLPTRLVYCSSAGSGHILRWGGGGEGVHPDP